jgi:hypothetical protein
MAVTDYDFNQTRNEIIARAFRICGDLPLGQSLSAEQYVQGTQALNSLVKLWQADHIFLWTLRTGTQALTSTNASYSLSTKDPSILWLDRAWIVVNSDDTPIEVIDWRQYQDIQDKTSQGQPDRVCIDNRISPTMYVWPTPGTSYTLKYLAVVKLQDFDTAAGNPDTLQTFLDALAYGLAWNLSDEIGLQLGERKLIEQKYKEFFAIAKKADRHRPEYEVVSSAFRRP